MIPKKVLMVGGNFIDNVRPSGYFRKLHEELSKNESLTINYVNGESFTVLKDCADSVTDYDIVVWFANVPNEYAKTVALLKSTNPNIILITSKNNLDNRYEYPALVARMLSVKANLSLIFTKSGESVLGTLLDPLGNAFIVAEPDISKVAEALTARAIELCGYTRMGSDTVGEAQDIPYNEQFFNIARSYANTFHALLHASNTERYLGNLSFRCTRGFPSFKQDDLIYVSMRNIDKRSIGVEGFVAVSPDYVDGKVGYYGDTKPSVDTPIQVALYNKYPKIRYMLHSHVYVVGAPFTDHKVPCGALEEIDIIVKIMPELSEHLTEFAVNLLGHGSIVMTNDLAYFNHIRYYGRDIPELDAHK